MYDPGVTSLRQSYVRGTETTLSSLAEVISETLVRLWVVTSTCMNSPDILQCEAAPHGFFNSLSVFLSSLFTESYFVADAVHTCQA